MAANKDGFKVLHTLSVKPSKIVLTEQFQGRRKPVADEEVITLADTLRREGQQQPLQVRQVKGADTVEAIFGNTRQRAGMLIENGYKDNSGKEIKADPNFVLRCEVVDITNESALIGNIVENIHRNATTMVDNYGNQKLLREPPHSMSDAAIARLYGVNQAMITRTKKLAAFDTPELAFILDAIHNGECTFSAGVILADAKDVAEANAYEKVWEKRSQDSEGVFTQERMVSAIKLWRDEVKAVKDAELSKAGTAGGEGGDNDDDKSKGTAGTASDTPGKTYPRSIKELREVFSTIAGQKRTPDSIIGIANKMLEVIAGKCDADGFSALLCQELGVAPLTDDEVTAREAQRAAEAAKVAADADKLAADAKAKATPAAAPVAPVVTNSEPLDGSTQPITPERDSNNAPKKKGGKAGKAKAGKK